MKRCKKCSADVLWIQSCNGSIACNPEQVYYIEDKNGKECIVTPNGEVISCKYIDDPYKATGIGYIKHSTTCTMD